MKPKRIMVRVATFVSLLLAGMVVVGAAGADDNESPRSSVIISDAAKATSSTMMMTTTTVVDGVPVPVPTRKLTKNSKASKDDAAAVSEEVQGLLRLLVFEKAVDLYRSTEQSSFEDAVVENDYKEYACTGCVGFFTRGTQLPPDEQKEFCQDVILEVFSKIAIISHCQWPGILSFTQNYCSALFQCSSTPTMCCQSRGVCLATYGATGPTTGDGIPIGESCIYSDDCAIPPGLEHGVCLYPSYGFPGTCRSGQPGVFCGRTSDCVIPKGLKHPVCRRDKCQR